MILQANKNAALLSIAPPSESDLDANGCSKDEIASSRTLKRDSIPYCLNFSEIIFKLNSDEFNFTGMQLKVNFYFTNRIVF